MKIDSLSFVDNARKWRLERADFDKLTLLVGASGVGKTQILKSIIALKDISEGKPGSGIKWDIKFSVLSGDKYEWSGEFENLGDFDRFEDDDNSKKKSAILKEKVSRNGKIIIKRTSDSIFFDDKQTVKLPNHQSVIYLLKEEELIKPAFDGFKKIVLSDQTDSQTKPLRINFSDTEKLLRNHKTLDEIRESDEETTTKLFLVYKNAQKTFNLIKERYSDIFPHVEDVKVEPLNYEDEDVPFFFRQVPFIQIKEIGVEQWIVQKNISSGMFRTLIHISEIYLSNEGSLFLIDEFENSLGINCINELTNDILSSNRQIQFILTSHHPYIINNISPTNWKIVTRSKGVVKTHKADQFEIGKSKHEAFMQLIQLEEYKTGISE
jgi:predicted ATPase